MTGLTLYSVISYNGNTVTTIITNVVAMDDSYYQFTSCGFDIPCPQPNTYNPHLTFPTLVLLFYYYLLLLLPITTISLLPHGSRPIGSEYSGDEIFNIHPYFISRKKFKRVE
uniref:Uncharacterized protein n=1 Tax=Cacopsylla melanoneura TaxID=428564 RepID=A0A8D9BWT7_9HEMI